MEIEKLAEDIARYAFGGPLGAQGQAYSRLREYTERRLSNAQAREADEPFNLSPAEKTHLELIQQGGRQYLITHLAGNDHRADARWNMASASIDDLLAKHADLHLHSEEDAAQGFLIEHLTSETGHHAGLVLDRGLLLGRTQAELLAKHTELHEVTER